MSTEPLTCQNGRTTETQTVLASGYFIVSGEKIRILPLSARNMSGKAHPARSPFPTLLELERDYIDKILAHVNGNKTRAAQLLGITRISLWRKLKRYAALTPRPR